MKKISMIILLLFSTSTYAAMPISELGTYLNQSVNQYECKLQGREWDANYIHLSVGASVAFDIPEIFEVQLVPQLTFIWTKENEE